MVFGLTKGQGDSVKKEQEEWGDAVVKVIWRPVAIGLCVGLPAAYFLYTTVIGKRYPTAAHIPPEVFNKRTVIRGKVMSVGDSDNFRIYHTPGIGWGWWRHIPKTRKELRDQTIPIRIAGVDAPEGAHFGMPKQPFYDESKAYLTSLVQNRFVKVELLARDQYNRAVGMVYIRSPPFFTRKNVSEEMLKQGMASLYVAKGAAYADQKHRLEKAEARAK
ncbi:SNase-domain-containing protein [Hesseltinella vesiculosa]|uniref:SNase-domain-containing protein n=1 Tax=Hesseltinella vesiculosa TaxID=101127 RepID=A0A1X2GC00_9FUNG|nr:SNase-domain-containing protein [Hesseltinella vesiculosa]